MPQDYTRDDLAAESNPDKWDAILSDPKTARTPADAFLGNQHKGDLLVGMGDNFGVTLESRSYLKDGQVKAKSRNLDDPSWNSAPPGQIGDNVGCFLSRAGYDAIVPGKDDFYFGPERLRQIAKRLANIPSERKSEAIYPVRMLAANLVLKTEYIKKPDKIPDSDKQLLFIPGMPTGIKSMDISDNGVLPSFTRQIRFEVSSTSFYDVKLPKALFDPFLCQVSTDVGIDGVNPDQCLTRVPLVRETVPDPDSKLPGKAVWDYTLKDWPPTQLPALYGLCSKVAKDEFRERDADNVYNKQSVKQYYCIRFSVPEPLLGEATTQPWLLKRVNLRTCEKPAAICNGKEITCEAGQDNCRNGEPDCEHGKDVCLDGASQETYAVVFGVVDKDLIGFVGRDNLSWRNQHAKVRAGHSSNKSVPPGKEVYGTTVDALDEATTLGLAMRSFDLDWEVHHANARLYKVLLAQMTRGKAEALAANLANSNFSSTSERFDLVISAAADFSAATPNETLTIDRPPKTPVKTTTKTQGPDQDSKLPEFRHVVVVPWLGYDSSGHRLPNPIRSVTLTDSNPSPQPQPTDTRTSAVGGHYEEWFPLSESVNQDKLKACYDMIARDFLKDQKHYWREQLPSATGNNNEPDCSNFSSTDDLKPLAPKLTGAFELAVLAALRDRTHADVAMLQKRSFYWGPFPSPLDKRASLAHPNGELLDRILWQGDFLKILAVKGSTFKKVLDESDKLDALDEQATNEVVETKRGLLALGIEKTRDKQYLVDGMQLDPNRLYTVATSNHIAAGDNGYPELAADPQLLDVRLPTGKEDTPRISWVVCEAVKNSQGNQDCEPKSVLLFASIQDPTPLPPQLEPPLTALAKAYKHSVFGNPDLPRDTFSRTNYQAQLVPTWRISLNDLSFSLSSVRNNLTEPQRLTELGGVTEPLAGNAKSHSINFSTHEEWVRSGKWTDEFLRGMFQFQDTVTGNTLQVPILTSSGTLVNTLASAPAITTYTQNQGAIDSGIFWHPGAPWHLSPHKYFTKFGFVLEPLTHFDTQLASQDLIFPPVPDPAGSGKILVPKIPINLPFNQDWLGRFGFRGESDKNHLEIGYQGGWELKALETLSSNLGSCPPVSVTLCVESWELQPTFVPGSISQTRDRRERNGPYMDMDWSWPLIWRLSLRTQESFAYYLPAHFDNAIDTLYRNDVIETLNLKLFPNLNFGPSLERFDYENKFGHVHLRTWSPTFKATYSFDWLEGSRRGKSFRYPSSAGGPTSE